MTRKSPSPQGNWDMTTVSTASDPPSFPPSDPPSFPPSAPPSDPLTLQTLYTNQWVDLRHLRGLTSTEATSGNAFESSFNATFEKKDVKRRSNPSAGASMTVPCTLAITNHPTPSFTSAWHCCCWGLALLLLMNSRDSQVRRNFEVHSTPSIWYIPRGNPFETTTVTPKKKRGIGKRKISIIVH